MQVTKLRWGVKQSFRGYVEAAGGTIAAAGGATRAPDGAFVFEPLAGGTLAFGADGSLAQGRADFRGEVCFEAHGGLLKVFLADPAVEIGPDGGVLSVADSPVRDRRIALAKLDLAAAGAGEDGALAIPTAITLDGMFLLGDHYPPGTVLDPVRVG